MFFWKGKREKTDGYELPETADPVDMTEEDRDVETTDADLGRYWSRNFWKGFISGAAASLFGILVFCTGWMIGLRNDRAENTRTENAGAEVLTDGSTLRRLNEVQALIEQHYLNKIDGEMLGDYLMKGAAAGLNDPYAAYYSREELTSVLDSSRGEYFGIGAVISENIQTGELTIVQVYEESPAEKCGLMPGDMVILFEEEAAQLLGLSDLVTKIKSAEGEFDLTVYRPETEEELTFTLACDEITVSHVEYEMMDDKVGYIQITEFTESAVDGFREAVGNLNRQGMQKLIVDLRSNPGGLFTSVCDILEEILPEGLIVYTEDRNGKREEVYADNERSVECEIAVLVDGYSASASEIFAGAVQDYELGPVIGTQTYGKGVVQKTYPLSDGSAFKMTVEKYYTAKGQDIEGNGITPDITVEEQNRKSTDTAGPEDVVTEDKDETAEKRDADPVLARALKELTD